MALESGTAVGPYTVLGPLGAGGMGVVVRARDERLGREVALKLLGDDVAADPERQARFEREARLLASLSHPNVGALYGLETLPDGARCLVLELIPGESLEDRLARGALALDEALDLAAQVASGLEAAHEVGIVHRDLKPANVRITPDGRVKLLDFGLAKGPAGDASTVSGPDSLTRTSDGTIAGTILGTAAYMSPEQARGRPVDRRSDIWALGCLLYETLAGLRPFEGETPVDVLAAILHKEPDWSRLPADTPASVRLLLRQALEKDPRRRLRDAGDVRLALEEAARTPAAAAGETRARSRWGAALAAGLAGLVLGGGLGVLLRPAPEAPLAARPAHLSVLVPDDLTLLGGTGFAGTRIFAVGRPKADPASPARAYVRGLGEDAWVPLQGTDGVVAGAISPDGEMLALVAPRGPNSPQKALYKLPTDGSSPPRLVGPWEDRWGTVAWLDGGDLLTTEGGRALVRVSGRDGSPGAPVPVDSGDDPIVFQPTRQVRPGGPVLGQSVRYTARGFQTGIALADPQTGRARVLVPEGGSPRFLPPDRLLFTRGDTLLSVRFDPGRGEVTGEPEALHRGLRTPNVWSHAAFDLGPDGSLAFVPGGLGGSRRRLMLLRPDGTTAPWSDERRPFEGGMAVSADGGRIAASIANTEGLYELWISDRDRPLLRRLPGIPGTDCAYPVWSPRGDLVAFASLSRSDRDGIYVVRPEDGAAPVRIAAARPDDPLIPTAWSPDGRLLLAVSQAGGVTDIVRLPVGPAPAGPVAPEPYLGGSGDQLDASFSPDGRWVAWASSESGDFQVYAAPLRPDGRPGIPQQVSRGAVPSSHPHWTDGGRRLVYVTANLQLMTADLDGGRVGPPRPAADFQAIRASQPLQMMDVLADGSILYAEQGEDEGEIRRVDVILNWAARLE